MLSTKAPTNLHEFTSRFSTEEACAEYLFELRWPKGFVCPRCGTNHGRQIRSRAKIEYANPSCRYQVSITAGTVLHCTKQQLTTWFHAAYLVSTLTPGISAAVGTFPIRNSIHHAAQTQVGHGCSWAYPTERRGGS